MDILTNLSRKPKVFIFSSSYEASIARGGIMQLVRRTGLKDVHVIRKGNRITAWQCKMDEIKFTVPQRKFNPEPLAKAQKAWAGEQRA